ncbi:uncharacterized protein EI97DRAFT_435230 [Westerdykella ornata]|uniref:Uncharacterized protein n=1 Tax=Westerdykella ornata TaxID=318751 RepID=A0A6A6JDP6_WESOR|nr:uncharacterized protein EI97DRAFT_435230 [Westerdykella ornata]KAF2274395.1 hypothetical protein EI97DRAFT_435230 [Westerdykella ornata]
MVILGGLEIVVGGVLIHHYHKKHKKQKRLKQQEEEQSLQTEARRRNSYPGPQSSNPQIPQPQQKSAYPYRSPPQYGSPQQQQRHPRFHIARQHDRSQHQPVSRPKTQLGDRPPVEPLRRQDSFATIRDVPDGPRYTGRQANPPSQRAQHLAPSPSRSIRFSRSVPSFERATMPPQMGPHQRNGGPIVDGNRDTHAPLAVTTTRYDDDDDPPPPYEP